MICTSCQKPKDKLTAVRSEILPSMTLTLCQACKDSRNEPRFLIILEGRQNGFDSVKDYISKRRYVGEDIMAYEFA